MTIGRHIKKLTQNPTKDGDTRAEHVDLLLRVLAHVRPAKESSKGFRVQFTPTFSTFIAK